MLREPTAYQHELEMVTLESLVPADHLVRKIDAAIDLSFIRAKVAHLYCADNGRPAIDPVLLFKLLLLGYLFGVRSERQLVRDVQVNVAYRWFLGLRLTDKVPDASTISQNRRRRFADSQIYQEIFDEIVLQAIGRGMVQGKVLYTDSTHLKASANKNKAEQGEVAVPAQAYLQELDAAVDADRLARGKRALKRTDKDDEPPPTRPAKVSRTDPDSGYMAREGKPKGFFYLDHRTVDAKHAIITDTHVTPGNVNDSVPYLARLDRQRERFNLNPYAVGVDAGYFTAAVCKGLEDRLIAGVMGYRRPAQRAGYFYKREYKYDAQTDTYVCPNNQTLTYSTTNREGYREYRSDRTQCASCPVRAKCTKSATGVKVVMRHLWEEAKERVKARRFKPSGQRIYARRQETVERSFADAKQLHGHRYARLRGLKKVMEQCLLAAAAQNMKKIALLLARFLASFNVLARLYQAQLIATKHVLRAWLAQPSKQLRLA